MFSDYKTDTLTPTVHCPPFVENKECLLMYYFIVMGKERKFFGS